MPLVPPTAYRGSSLSKLFDVCPGFRDAAENLTALRFRFDIANPHLKPTFSVLRGSWTKVESTVTVDRRRRCQEA